MDHYATIYGYITGMSKPVVVGAIQHPNPTQEDIQRCLSKFRAHPRNPKGVKYFSTLKQRSAPRHVPQPTYAEYSQHANSDPS